MDISKRIILLRHSEEPKQKRIEKIQTRIGLNNQGVVRTSLMPELIHKLIGNKAYELHTYTHPFKDEPTSRSYYTSQLLQHQVLYEKSDDIHHLVDNIKNSKANIIIIFWEHCEIPKVIHELIDIKIDWDHTSKKIYKRLNKKYKLVEKKTVSLKDLKDIKYCADGFIKENIDTRDYYIKPNESIGYALVWDINYDKKEYKVYPNYLIKKCKNHNKRFKVFKYI
jgi:hypothetical protein